MKLKPIALLLLGSLVSAAPVFAHHSGAMFDRNKTIEVKGVVKEFLFQNPHSWILVTAPGPGGKSVQWELEAAAPRLMTVWGITPSVIKPGDKISVRTHPLRDGRRGGALVDITLANGKVISTEKAQPEHGKPRF